MIILYPFPYQTFAVVVSGILLLVVVSIATIIYRLIVKRVSELFRKWINRVLLIGGITLGILLVSGLSLSLIKIHQVNHQLGFRYATPETPAGEIFIISKVEAGKTMESAGFRVDDQIQFSAVDDLYALLVNNQGSEVNIPVMRNSKPLMISISVPEMHIPGLKIWPFNRF
jgi:hypothetical protein